MLRPGAFAERFTEWVLSLGAQLDGEVVAIDGKSLRCSRDGTTGKSAIHLVSAFATQNRLLLGQVSCEEKSNEITAVPRLLRLLDLRGCIVSIDAMGCQKAIAEQIIDGGGDYVLHLKANHPTLHDELALFFHDARATDFEEIDYDYDETEAHGHDRDEVRRVWSVSWVDWLTDREAWKGLSSVILVERERTVLGKKTSKEQSLYISSISGVSARKAAAVVRGHWGIENHLHWVLDVTFREDECRVRKRHGPENLATIRRIVLNLLKMETSHRGSIKTKQFRAAIDQAYLLEVAGL